MEIRWASRALCVAILAGCSQGGGCSQAADAAAAKPADVPSVTLRFKPADAAKYREQWVYDVAIPGEGLRRDILSFDVAMLSRMDQGSYALRHTVRSRNATLDGHSIYERNLAGVSISQQWGSDHSVVGEIAVTAKTFELETALRSLIEMQSFGVLIEYPDQAVAIGDSWSIEPRTHSLPGGLSATLRPTYTLESIESLSARVDAVIAVDMQVDLIPSQVVEGVTIEGGGSASGTLRVSVADGVLRDAKTGLHFSQEIMVQGTEVLGFREISSNAHVFTLASNAAEPPQEPVALEAPEDDSECSQTLELAAERVGTAEGRQRVHLVSALHGEGLPAAHGGSQLRDSAMSLVVLGDAEAVELDGTVVELKALQTVLREANPNRRAIYLYADASLPLEKLRSVVGALPRQPAPRLVVRDPGAPMQPPKASRWLEERLRLALSAPDSLERQIRLHSLLHAHLALCEPAEEAFRTALNAGAKSNPTELPAEIVQAFTKCGCTSTNLEGLEATLVAIFGSQDLRSLALPRRIEDPKWNSVQTVRDFALRLTGAGRADQLAPR